MNILLNKDGSPFLYNGKYINLVDNTISTFARRDLSDNSIVEISLDEVLELGNDNQIVNDSVIKKLLLNVEGENWAFVDDKTSNLIIKTPNIDVDSILYIDVVDNLDDFNAIRDYNCPLLQDIKNIEISEGVTNISSDCFYGKRGLDKIILPESIISINSRSFNSCGLKEITIPRNVNFISDTAFLGNQSTLEKITVDESNEKYSCYRDSNCIVDNTYNKTIDNTAITKALVLGCKNTRIPSGVEYVSVKAFYRCYDLETIKIPKSVKYIDHRAFSECYNLKLIEYEGSSIDWKNIKTRSGLFSISSWSTNTKSANAFYGCRDDLKVKCTDKTMTAVDE